MHRRNSISTILSIAGSDNTGGAGIQADIKTSCVFGVYAATVVTAVTAQSPSGVERIQGMDTDMIRAQIDSIYSCMSPQAVKIGMLPSPESVICVANKLREYHAHQIVIDPVLCASTGDSLTGKIEDTLEAMKSELFPLAALVTPNIPEAMKILDLTKPLDEEEMCRRLKKITGAAAVLLKGGHSNDEYSTDFLFNGHQFMKYRQWRIETTNTHGTGCALSTAIACGLAMRQTLPKAVRIAKDFISYAIHQASELNIIKGNGPLYLFK